MDWGLVGRGGASVDFVLVLRLGCGWRACLTDEFHACAISISCNGLRAFFLSLFFFCVHEIIIVEASSRLCHAFIGCVAADRR